MVASLLAPSSASHAQSSYMAGTPYLVVETGQRFTRLQDALFAIGDGVGTINVAPGTYQDCGVQVAGRVTFKAQIAGQSTFDSQMCEGKAALVLRGRMARVEGLVFANFHMSDGNGAGIRLEKGDLTVTQSWFHDSEDGILGGDDPSGNVVIDRSTFTRLGRCDRGLACAHSVYIGDFGSVTVTHSRFEAGSGGHYLKTRSGQVRITDNSFDDSQGRATNYMIDLPAGASGRISGNYFVQGSENTNHYTLIAVGAESRLHASHDLRIERNVARFAPGLDWSAALVGDWSGEKIAISDNDLASGIIPFQRKMRMADVKDRLQQMPGAVALGRKIADIMGVGR